MRAPPESNPDRGAPSDTFDSCEGLGPDYVGRPAAAGIKPLTSSTFTGSRDSEEGIGTLTQGSS